MTKSFNQKARSAFKKLEAVALMVATLAMCFTACKQTGNTGGGKPTPKTKYSVSFNVGLGHGKIKAKVDGITETETSPIKVEEGKTITFTAKADEGYQVKGWTLEGKAVNGTKTEYKLTITKPATVKLFFEKIPPAKYTVTLTQTEHGKVTASPEIPADKQVDKDTEITFTAKANDGYRVNTWVISPSSAILSGGEKGNETAKVKITADTSVSVNFELIPEEVVLTLDPNKLTIGISAKTADGKPIEVEGCTETTFASDEDAELHATGTVVTLRGKITKLECNDNQLVALNVKNLTSLEELLCRKNQLTDLDASGLTALKTLGCNSNQLTSLNVSGCTALEKLGCFRNQLTSLNVLGCTALEELGCHGNQLTTVDISGLTALKRISCYTNQLNAEEMTKLLKALPAREASNDVKATLYTEKTGENEGNCKDFSQSETLKAAFKEARGKNWKLLKEKTDGTEVDILLTYAINFGVEGSGGKLTVQADGVAETETSPINVEEGKTVTFTAKANDGYRGKEWKVDSTVVANNKTTTYTHTVTKAVTVKVSFESNGTTPNPPTPTKYTVTLNKTEHGTVTSSPEIPEDKKVDKDTVITFTATANDGYKIGKWTVTGSVLETGTGAVGSETAKVKITANTTVSVSFEAIPPTKHTVTLNQTANGTVTASPAIPQDKLMPKDTEITFTAKANDGYRVGTWTVLPSSAIKSGGGKGETTATLKITANTTVSVSFEAIPPTKHTVTLNQTEHGTVTSSPAIPADKLMPKDTEITFTATADSGYRVNTWVISPSSAIQSGGSKGETMATLKITADTSVSVSFIKNTYAITFGVKGKNGILFAKAEGMATITHTSPITVEHGKTVTFTATANYGYKVKEWKVGGEVVANNKTNTYTHTVTQACHVSVSFEAIPEPKAILTLSPDNLTIKVKAKTKDGSAIVVEGCNVTTLASDTETALIARGINVILKGEITELSLWTIPFTINSLTALNVQGLTALQKLWCRENKLTSLNVQDCTALKELNCQWNKLTALNVQGCTSLQRLSCSNNQLTALNVQGLTTLLGLDCSGNQLTSLNVQGLTALQELLCSGNQLPELNVQGLTSLQVLECGSNKLTSLDVQGLTALQDLRCVSNWLTDLDVSGCASLQKLDCFYNKLTALDVSGCASLQELDCSIGQLTKLNVQGLTSLQKLYCFKNQLTSLNVQGLTSLQELDCRHNKLPELNVQGLTSLQELDCRHNKLTALNVQGCTALQKLECHINQLNAQVMKEILNALPAREATDNAWAILYTEKKGVTEGNHKDFTHPAELKTALKGAKSRNWKLKKFNESGNDVDI